MHNLRINIIIKDCNGVWKDWKDKELVFANGQLPRETGTTWQTTKQTNVAYEFIIR